MLRKTLLALTLLAAGAVPVASAADPIHSVRAYLSAESTRLVLESKRPITYTEQRLVGPPRLVFDIHSRTGDGILSEINAVDTSSVPYISVLRAGRNSPERLRIVFELAEEVEHNVFDLEPVRDYRHRLMIDVVPREKPDPLLALLNSLEEKTKEAPIEPPAGLPRKDYIAELLRSLRPFIVAIDPGHGGDDPGAVAGNGLLEKRIVLDIAHRLKKELDMTPGINALLTRDSDYFVALGERVRKAHRYSADLFVSIHADAFHSPKPKGTSVFVLSKKGASSKFARTLAAQENLSDLVGGADADFVARDESEERLLKAMSFDGKQHASKLLAHQVRGHLGEVAHSHGDNVESAGFAVLKSPSIPSVLIETGFLSNPEEARLLGQEEYRQKIAETVAKAVVEYHSQYHPETAYATQ